MEMKHWLFPPRVEQVIGIREVEGHLVRQEEEEEQEGQHWEAQEEEPIGNRIPRREEQMLRQEGPTKPRHSLSVA